MCRRAVLLKLLLLISVNASSDGLKSPILESISLQMIQDYSSHLDVNNDEVSLHKVWRLKYVKKLHPMFSGMNTGVVEGEWSIVDFTNPDTIKVITREGNEYSQPYKVINKEVVFPTSNRKKKLKKHEIRISMHVSLLTSHHLGITHYMHAGKNKKEAEGKFIEWVFEEVQ